ncbi:MAG TPA: helix-turn-helix transcriptional regulator [Pyrinomonadaceae bacterium]|nr:helix-turn-helix transcriptional regulator [Pyrinomonadaceae bacterium]
MNEEGAENAGNIDMHIWSSQALSELLAATPTLVRFPLRRGIIKSLNTLIGGCKEGLPFLARKFQIHKTTLWQWVKGKSIPSLGLLLKICFRINANILEFLRGDIAASQLHLETELPADIDSISSTVTRTRKLPNKPEIQRALLTAIKEIPPTSLEGIARRLRQASNTLRYKFPKLCKAIVKRYASYRANLLITGEERIGKMFKGLIGSVSASASLTAIAKQLNCDVKTLKKHAPKFCHAVAKQQADVRKQRLENLREILVAALSEFPPPSILKIAERHGCSKSSLYAHFADLCHVLARRRSQYRGTKILRAAI